MRLSLVPAGRPAPPQLRRRDSQVATTLDLDEELSLQEGSWRGRFITFGVLLAIAAFAVVAVYFLFGRDEETAVRSTEDVTVVRATINSSLVISGTADAQLNSDLAFQSSGKVALVNVKVGDAVAEGQVLASLEADDLTNAVTAAQSQQLAAQLKLDDLVGGSSAAELAVADQSVAQADAALVKAENDYADLLDGATDADLATAQQAVAVAESNLAQTASARQKLEDTPSAVDVATAESGLASAQSALTAAENSADNARNTQTSAEASLKSAEASYCNIVPAPSPSPGFCTSPSVPISSGDIAILNDALSGSNAGLASGAIGANGTYLSARNSVESADAAADSAQGSLNAAQAKLDAVEDGPTPEEMTYANAAVAAAQRAVDAARAKLADAEEGATASQLSSAAAAVDSARASVDAAQARYAEAFRGPEANAIAQARQAVRAAQISVEAAQIRLKNAQIIAPFKGTVAAVNVTAGEFAGVSTQTPAIVLLTPEALVLKIDVNETDYPTIKLGQGGVALFDGIPGSVYPFTISEIGLAPTVTQGVVTFDVKATMVVLGENARPAPGMNARGQLTIGSTADVLVVPPRAIRRRGSEQVVDVKREGGLVEEVVVTTGISDNTNVQILTGLADGDIVVVPAIASSGSGPGGGGPTPVPTLPGGLR